MGAWNSARNYIEWTLDHIKAENRKVDYIGRDTSCVPSDGIFKKTSCAAKKNNRKGT